MQNLEVSVIITTIGRDSLVEAVKSVQDQTFEEWELIIVNDNPEFVCPAFYDERIRVINNLERLGGTKSLNVGLANSKGKYIAILDDDDLWISKDKLERQVNFLDGHKDYIACGTNPQIMQNTEIKINLTGTPFAHSSILFRCGLEYDESLERAKDLDLMLRLSRLGKLGLINFCETKINLTNDLNKKIKDCYWHRKVILMHKEFSNWLIIYIKLWLREIKLRRYSLMNGLRKNGGRQEK